MKKIITAIFASLILTGCATTPSGPSIEGTDFKSGLGFTSKIDTKWSVFNRNLFEENPEIFESDIFSSVDAETMKQLKEVIMSGQMEMFYSSVPDTEFADNINIFKIADEKIDYSNTALLCSMMPQMLSQQLGVEVKLDKCTYEKVGNVKAFMIVFGGLVPDTTSYGYQFHTPDSTVNLTLSCRNSRCKGLEKDIEYFFDNIKFN